MSSSPHSRHSRADLADVAKQAMIDRGLEPEFSAAAQTQLAGIAGPARENDPGIRDLTSFLWCSIDNDDSKDLDQLSGHSDRRPRADEHDVRLHRGADFSDAARAALDGPDFAEPGRGPALHGRRDGARSGR
jgi:hypothetical protein